MTHYKQQCGGTTVTEFVPWPKIYRLNRDIVVTEKIDGTNAAVGISTDGTQVWAQSRTRIITPGSDNFGFAAWVAEHEDELKCLGPGIHHGEWYGRGIQRGYDLDDKRFMLFNTARWNEEERPPKCCEWGTVLYQGPMDTEEIDRTVELLRNRGSQHVPGFLKPEGIVVFHTAANLCFKVTLEKDEQHKYER